MAATDVPELAVSLRSLDALFDRSDPPPYPHAGPIVRPDLASYLESRARARERAPSLRLTIAVSDGAPPAADEEATARRAVQAYFAEERELAALDLEVNQEEGWGFFRRTFPLLVAALGVSGVLYLVIAGAPSGGFGSLVTALFYLFFITIVWVLLWDPIEKLLFDAYLLRSRMRALGKLAAAPVTFRYGAPVAPATAP